MRILIANRGEIALRVMRTARAMGYGCVAIHTPDEAGAPHVVAADLAVAVPGYLDGAAILAAAQATGAGMIHPGYGFLSENADFAKACAEAGLTFIGPSAQAIAVLEKARAQRVGLRRLVALHDRPCGRIDQIHLRREGIAKEAGDTKRDIDPRAIE